MTPPTKIDDSFSAKIQAEIALYTDPANYSFQPPFDDLSSVARYCILNGRPIVIGCYWPLDDNWHTRQTFNDLWNEVKPRSLTLVSLSTGNIWGRC